MGYFNKDSFWKLNCTQYNNSEQVTNLAAFYRTILIQILSMEDWNI